MSIPGISPNGILCLKCTYSWIIKMLSIFSYVRWTINSRNNLLIRINKSRILWLFCDQSLNNTIHFICNCQNFFNIRPGVTKYGTWSHNRVWSISNHFSYFFSHISITISSRQNFGLVIPTLGWVFSSIYTRSKFSWVSCSICRTKGVIWFAWYAFISSTNSKSWIFWSRNTFPHLSVPFKTFCLGSLGWGGSKTI